METIKEAIKVFGKDYVELMKHSFKFSKDHWKGLLITTAVIGGIEYALLTVEFKRQDAKIQKKLDWATGALKEETDEVVEKIKGMINES